MVVQNGAVAISVLKSYFDVKCNGGNSVKGEKPRNEFNKQALATIYAKYSFLLLGRFRKRTTNVNVNDNDILQIDFSLAFVVCRPRLRLRTLCRLVSKPH